MPGKAWKGSVYGFENICFTIPENSFAAAFNPSITKIDGFVNRDAEILLDNIHNEVEDESDTFYREKFKIP